MRKPAGSPGAVRRGTSPRSWSDVVLAAALAGGAVLELLTGVSGSRDPGQPAITPAQIALVLLLTLPLAVRRIAPVAVGLGIPAAFATATTVLTPVEVFLSSVTVFVLAPYAAAVGARTWRGSAASGLTATALLAVQGLLDGRYGLGGAVVNSSYALLVWAVAALVRRYREAADAARRLAVAQAELAVQADRRRMARDMHDVVAHGLSVVVLRARGAAHDLDDDPSSAGQALRDIDAVASRALEDMRRLLTVTGAAGSTPRAPQPTLADLPDLVRDVRVTGLDVQLTTTGAPGTLTPGAELAAYRVVQESLTNVVRHAGARHTEIHLCWDRDALVVEVVDDGTAPPVGATGEHAGRGLQGMHERVRLAGGRLACGSAPGGGFRVRAEVPVVP